MSRSQPLDGTPPPSISPAPISRAAMDFLLQASNPGKPRQAHARAGHDSGGLRPKPAVLVCASAIGIYGSRGEELLTEGSLPGSGFLPEVCLAWEQATQPAADAGIRVVHLRFGVVLSPNGGACADAPVFRAGLGGWLGSGRQWMSWAVLPDVIRAIEFALQTASLSGPVNV